MSGIYPETPGYPASQADNAYIPETKPLASCPPLYYGRDCAQTLDVNALNALISELSAIADAAGNPWNCNKLTNAIDAIKELICAGIFRIGVNTPNANTPTCPPLYLKSSTCELWAWKGNAWCPIGGGGGGGGGDPLDCATVDPFVITRGNGSPGGSTPTCPSFYLDVDTCTLWVWKGTAWCSIGGEAGCSPSIEVARVDVSSAQNELWLDFAADRYSRLDIEFFALTPNVWSGAAAGLLEISFFSGASLISSQWWWNAGGGSGPFTRISGHSEWFFSPRTHRPAKQLTDDIFTTGALAPPFVPPAPAPALGITGGLEQVQIGSGAGIVYSQGGFAAGGSPINRIRIRHLRCTDLYNGVYTAQTWTAGTVRLMGTFAEPECAEAPPTSSPAGKTLVALASFENMVATAIFGCSISGGGGSFGGSAVVLNDPLASYDVVPALSRVGQGTDGGDAFHNGVSIANKTSAGFDLSFAQLDGDDTFSGHVMVFA